MKQFHEMGITEMQWVTVVTCLDCPIAKIVCYNDNSTGKECKHNNGETVENDHVCGNHPSISYSQMPYREVDLCGNCRHYEDDEKDCRFCSISLETRYNCRCVFHDRGGQ